MSTSRRKYKNPPIVEALCEFRFEPSEEWNLTVPGLIFQELKHVYDGKPRQRQAVEAGIQVGGPGISVRQGIAAVQLPDKKNSKLLSVGPDVLSVHVMQPYPNWEGFKPLIEEGLSKYVDVTKPKGITRIGVRYVNRIVVKSGTVDPSELFTVFPGVPDEGTQNLEGFISRVEISYEGNPFRLIRTFATAQADAEDSRAFLLDLDAIGIWDKDSLAVDQTIPTVEELKKVERDAFEYFIADKARELFDE